MIWTAPAAGLLSVVLLAGCGGDGAADRDRAIGTTSDAELRPAPPRPPLVAPPCPAGAGNCSRAAGRIVFVERVDPDGDGDLHVVVTAGSITGPGLTAIDVRKGLRPERDPAIGDRASAAGPVQTGSYGQQQIHALRFRVER